MSYNKSKSELNLTIFWYNNFKIRISYRELNRIFKNWSWVTAKNLYWAWKLCIISIESLIKFWNYLTLSIIKLIRNGISKNGNYEKSITLL